MIPIRGFGIAVSLFACSLVSRLRVTTGADVGEIVLSANSVVEPILVLLLVLELAVEVFSL